MLKINALVDTGSLEGFISTDIAKRNRFKIIHCNSQVAMVIASLSLQVRGCILAGLESNQTNYTNTQFFMMPNLCCNVMLVHDFLYQNSSINLPFGGPKLTLNSCGLPAVSV